MAAHTPRQLRRVGVITALVLAVLLIAAFNLQHLPGMRGTTYHAEFSDSSGLHVGARVEVAGIRVGRVDHIAIDGAHVRVDFDVDGHPLGKDTTASIEVLNLLGEKFLNLTPKGSGQIEAGGTIPLKHTSASYDIVSTLSQLTDTTQKIDTTQLADSLNVLGDTLQQATPEIRSSFDGIARLSTTIASKNDDLASLLTNANDVVKLINDHSEELVNLMGQGNQIFTTLIQRRDDIHKLLVTATSLATQLKGLVKDNEKTIGPALKELDTAISFLNARKQELSDTVKYYGPYASILINIIGSGPWFDAYVPNLGGMATGEFVPGRRPGMAP
ncbi:MCE family protein [Nocardioides sp. Kera G14]|uniref:MCE family protein n=1 Tax=Nocardioides sp. Kera G14 TaxID=2884264 RepID=UPI001D0FF707|nr:MCE family protein [Nocardioides sp. Kera G14]UDY22305.1 MCE family protein [Nocardioides sp. Kera G14]